MCEFLSCRGFEDEEKNECQLETDSASKTKEVTISCVIPKESGKTITESSCLKDRKEGSKYTRYRDVARVSDFRDHNTQ